MKTNTKINKLPHSEIEIEGEIPTEEFERHRPRAIKNLSQSVDLPGFRKGHVPEAVIISKIGDVSILEEMAELALGEAYPEILQTHNIDAIGHPAITLTKLAVGNPLGFTIRTAVLPTLTLPDYKALAKDALKKKEEVKAEDDEVEKALSELRKLRAGWKPGENDADFDEANLPPIDDEFAKALGEFETIAELRVKIKENILAEKQRREKEKTRTRILESIIKKMDGDIPKILIETELRTMLEQLKSDVAAMGITFEQYITHTKKTEEEIRDELSPRAEDRVKSNLALAEIAKKEKITPDEKDIEKEVEHLLEHYKDADPIRTRSYVETVLTNEKVFEMLESE